MRIISFVLISAITVLVGCEQPQLLPTQTGQLTVTYDKNGAVGGSVPRDSYRYAAGETVVVKNNGGSLSKPGFAFAGWNTKSDGSGATRLPGEMFTIGTESMVLYALWLNSSITVSFEANGGSGTMVSQGVTTGTTVALSPVAMTRTGYAFAGWSTLAQGGGTQYADKGAFTPGTSPVVLYAQWKPNVYQVTFSANGGSGTVAAQTFTFDKPAPLNANGFTRSGYTFTGWLSNDGSSYADRSSFSTPAASSVLTAQWTPANNTLTFNANGGSGTQPAQTLTTGAQTTLDSNRYVRTGYTFARWDTLASGKGTAYADLGTFTMGSAPVVLYAQWKPNVYQVTFSANGGSGTVATQSFTFDNPAPLTANRFSRLGYTFAGWLSNDLSYYADMSSFSTPASSSVLTAQWSPAKNTLMFNANGGSGTQPTQTLTTGAQTTLESNRYVRTGYTFTRWDTLASGLGTAYADLGTFVMGSASTVLYAQWKPNSYQIKFDGNGGSGTVDTQTVVFGSTTPLHANQFSREGYLFSGWMADDGTSYSDCSPYVPQAADMTLRADWTRLYYTVSFNGNGGSGAQDPQILGAWAQGALDPNGFTRTGYTFARWDTLASGQGTPYADRSPFTMGASSVVLYAQWTPNPCRVTFVPNGGDGTMPDQGFFYEVPATLAKNQFTRTGYSFVGWTTPQGFTVGDGESYSASITPTTLSAQWVANSYLVTFDSNGGGGSMPSQTFTYDTPSALPINTFTKTGALFDGWSLTPGGPLVYADQGAYRTPANDAVLYARWSTEVSISWAPYSTLAFSPSVLTVHQGTNVALTPAVGGGSNWHWYVDNAEVAGATTGSYTFPAAVVGKHSIAVIVTVGAVTYSGSTIITVTQ